MGGAVSSLVSSVGDLVGGAADTVNNVVNKTVVDPLGDLYMQVRDPLEASAVVAGNYVLPGSSLITSQLVSDNAKEILASDVGQIANTAAGVGGGLQGNMSNWTGGASGATTTDALAADNIDVGGGYNPATGAGDLATAAGAAATGVTSSAGLGNLGSPTTATNSLLNSLIKRSIITGLLGGNTGTTNMATTTSNANLGNMLSGLLGTAGGLWQGASNTAALKDYANAITQAGTQAQAQGAFRPVGTTTTFGTSNFTIDPVTGQVTGSGYQLSPQAQAIQDALMAGTRTGLGDITTAQNLGRGYLTGSQGSPIQALGSQLMGSNVGAPVTQAGLGYLNVSPEAAAQQWYNQQQALLQPSREQDWAKLNQVNYNRGTTGLRVAQGGGLQAANPYASALANAQAQQNAALAAQATQQGLAQQQAGANLYNLGTGLTQNAQTTGAGLYGTGLGLTQQGQAFGQGLLSGAYAPVTAGLTSASTLESLGQQPLSLSTQLANLVSQRGAETGKLGLNAATQAGGLMAKANQYNPYASVLSNIGTSTTASGALGNIFGNTSLGTALGGLLGNLGTADLSNIDWASILPESSVTGSTPEQIASLVGGNDMASLLGL